MHVTVATTAEGCENWLLEFEVDEGTTIGVLKEILAKPPHSLGVTATTKVLGRQNGLLTTLYDNEAVQNHVTLLKVSPDKVIPFPRGFIWGAATAAYQIEGGALLGGRTPSIWDIFAAIPGRIQDGSSGAVACDHYHRFRQDVQLMKDLGLQAYRFSISWSRLLPAGRGFVNPDAVAFYGALLDELGKQGILPLVTLYHWDLPHCLEEEYGGWLSSRVAGDFEQYAAVCFDHFGDRVKHWVTFNEPWCSTALGYASGEHAPGHSKAPGTEPYQAAHHILLAHGRAVKRYREEYQVAQHGSIGIALNMDWKERLTDSEADTKAQRRALDWQLGWFMDPICKGDYPETMRTRCGERLPSFSVEERELLRGSLDFLGLNHYSTDFVSAKEGESEKSASYFADQEVHTISDPLWAKTHIGWDIVPWGLQRLLCHIQREYKLPEGILITENGCAIREEDAAQSKHDVARTEYLQGYIAQVHRAIQEGADVRGYFVWSLMDNFEWAFGYTKRFGIVRVDFDTQLRTPKDSAAFYSQVARSNTLQIPEKVLENSEFSPYNTRTVQRKKAAEGQGSKKSARPTLSNEDAKRMLLELSSRYEAPDFQRKMVDAFRRHMMDNDDVALMKSRRMICFPIQADVLPKYGFEPTTRGVAMATALVSSLEFNRDAEVWGLNQRVVYLTKDHPSAVALEGAVG